MADKQIRLQEPTSPLSSEGDFGATRYKPSYDWSQFNGDYPFVPKLFNTAASDVTRRVQPVEGGSSFDIPANSAWNGSFSNELNLWSWNTASPPTISGNTNAKSFIIGHKGVASSDNTVQCWQRGVVGISMKHKIQASSGLYGHYIDEATLLYRKWSDSSKFYGVDLIYNGNLLNNCRKNYTGRTPFKTNSPVREGYEGSFFVGLHPDHPAYQKISDDKLVFKGIYFKWQTYDSVTQFQGSIKLWNPRLLFDTSTSGDRGNRICLPRMWEFQQAGESNNLKLTYT